MRPGDAKASRGGKIPTSPCLEGTEKGGDASPHLSRDERVTIFPSTIFAMRPSSAITFRSCMAPQILGRSGKSIDIAKKLAHPTAHLIAWASGGALMKPKHDVAKSQRRMQPRCYSALFLRSGYRAP